MKTLVWAGVFIGGFLGSLVPNLWGDSSFLSFASLLCSTAGSAIGIWAGFKLGRGMGL